MMSVGKVLGSIVVVAAVAMSACSGDTEEATTAPPTTEADSAPASNAASTSTTQPADLESGEVLMSETLDPAGAITGGSVDRSYLATTYPAELEGLIGLAIADLAGRLGTDGSAVNVVLVEEVVWSDQSNGCPQPGMSYAQVLTDGLRIVLEADGILYDYRSGGSSEPALCEQSVDEDETRAGMFELTPEGEVIPVPVPDKDSEVPSEGLNPPDE